MTKQTHGKKARKQHTQAFKDEALDRGVFKVTTLSTFPHETI